MVAREFIPASERSSPSVTPFGRREDESPRYHGVALRAASGWRRRKVTIAGLVLIMTGGLLTGCGRTEAPRTATLLSINDVYRIEGTDGRTEGGLSRVRHLRQRLEQKAPDLLLFHAGDMLFPSLSSRLYQGEQMIDVLNQLDGSADGFDERMFATFGNHEFDKGKLDDAPMLQARVDESQFHWLASDIEWTRGDDGQPMIAADHLSRGQLVTSGGIRIGIFSLTTDFKSPAYVREFRSSETVAREMTAQLRGEGAEVVVALTHLRLSQDMDLLRQLGDDGPDLILGGHEHNLLHENVDGRFVLKSDAEARTATEVRITLSGGKDRSGNGKPKVEYEFHHLNAEVPTDPDVDVRVQFWLDRFDREYCAKIDRPSGCLEEVVGHTRSKLIGEELEMRRFETNYGNWIVDQGLQAFAGRGAQIAFVNAGGLRLNQDIPQGPIVLEYIGETFQYSSDLVLIKITGDVLQKIVDWAVQDWRGAGKWLQISGFAFRHDPSTETASNLTLLTPEGPRPIAPDEEILAVVNDFLATPGTGQDGYTMITREMWVSQDKESPALRDLVLQGLAAAGEEGIAPRVEGRICNTERDEGPCLVDGGA